MLSLNPTVNRSTSGELDIDRLTRGAQHVKTGNGYSHGSPSAPLHSGYAYVPPLCRSSEPRHPRRPQQEEGGDDEDEDDDDDNDNFIQAALFPLPPTLSLKKAGRPSNNPYYTYHTFPPPLSDPVSPNPTAASFSSSAENNAADSGDQESACYFETLDFSDYLHGDSHDPPNTANPGLANKSHTAGPPKPNLSSHRPAQHGHAYRPRRGRNYPAAFPAHLRGVYGSVGANLIGMEDGITNQLEPEAETVWRFKQTRRAVREMVTVVCTVLLVAGVLAGMGWGLTMVFEMWAAREEGGKFIAELSGGAAGGWGPCTAARPKFCHLIVEGGR